MLRRVSNSNLPMIKSTPVMTSSSCELSCILLSVDKSEVFPLNKRSFHGLLLKYSLDHFPHDRLRMDKVAIVQQLQDRALALGLFRRICRPDNCLVFFENDKITCGVDHPIAAGEAIDWRLPICKNNKRGKTLN
ncbi:G-type lectin S-receptor-like serine/threonine-protein kinase [Pyrus ussuriensis x Pyrus communis]|uniref:G-type lectin S-receptor-like serine/threonine-protein kinase n=1 Tax=Pyrus ussuriensis x Pyrus communis TaxID=2448454 RepID=A0A5N5GKY7_9ROSA|nr:G-type lectin S-receptor-like serine/threonine-protein kinase [Pyrus ussuriensis x Pyrus communis]